MSSVSQFLKIRIIEVKNNKIIIFVIQCLPEEKKFFPFWESRHMVTGDLVASELVSALLTGVTGGIQGFLVCWRVILE